MSEKHARTLSQPSNRAKAKDPKEKKVVFKGVLDSPFRIEWPSIPINLQNSVLAHITEKLEGSSKCRPRLLRLKGKEEVIARAKAQSSDASRNENMESIQKHDNSLPKTAHQIQAPTLLQHLVYGINQVTRRLESQTEGARRPIIATNTKEKKDVTVPLRCVLVCRDDIDPKVLVDHIPHLVATYNSTKPDQHVTLITLPRGSEIAIAQKLGVRRVAVLGIDNDYPHFDGIWSFLKRAPVLTAPWLSKPDEISSLIPTHVKHIRTTAPKDMKLAKKVRTQEKADAKKKRKLSQMLEEPN